MARFTRIQVATKMAEDGMIPVFFNSDPRGYALKIKDDYTRDITIYRDWGGYGILAPDFSE